MCTSAKNRCDIMAETNSQIDLSVEEIQLEYHKSASSGSNIIVHIKYSTLRKDWNSLKKISLSITFVHLNLAIADSVIQIVDHYGRIETLLSNIFHSVRRKFCSSSGGKQRTNLNDNMTRCTLDIYRMMKWQIL